jgi:hypothetical protein
MVTDLVCIRAASCSGDQSLKMWDTDEEKGTVGSVHANEPFTSFVFCGDVAGQTLIASLAYSIRIYKMRTLTLLHTIQLSDLKLKCVIDVIHIQLPIFFSN